jgi:glycosyltransferase involved in cell wall biosynthesis
VFWRCVLETVKVSLIVPVYNDEKYLENCLDSLTGQSLDEIEIICTNDGSTDGSSEILKNYAEKDSRIIVLDQKHSGPGKARNTALDKAHGRYILFCDADDSLELNAAYECSEIMDNTSCDMLIFNTHIIEDGRSVAGLKKPSGEYITLISDEIEGALDANGCTKTLLQATVWGKMFRTDLIKRYSMQFSRHMIGEDARFLLSYLLLVKSAYAVNKYYCNYYLRNKAVSYHATHPWLGRLVRFPGIFWDVFIFALRIGKPFRTYRFFHWLIVFFKSRKIEG